jgi:hypothetical protein
MRRAIVNFLIGAAYAAILVFCALALLSISGCANGVQMTDEERKACRDAETGCAVFTEQELDTLVKRAIAAGYRKGWTDAHKQGGHDL